MPLDLVTIERIDAVPTAKAGLLSYTITGVTSDRRTVQVQTVSAWRAAICERAKDSGAAIWIGSKDSRYGRDLVTVEFA